eukprot:3687663-Prymnesium_polylepis.1
MAAIHGGSARCRLALGLGRPRLRVVRRTRRNCYGGCAGHVGRSLARSAPLEAPLPPQRRHTRRPRGLTRARQRAHQRAHHSVGRRAYGHYFRSGGLGVRRRRYRELLERVDRLATLQSVRARQRGRRHTVLQCHALQRVERLHRVARRAGGWMRRSLGALRGRLLLARRAARGHESSSDHDRRAAVHKALRAAHVFVSGRAVRRTVLLLLRIAAARCVPGLYTRVRTSRMHSSTTAGPPLEAAAPPLAALPTKLPTDGVVMACRASSTGVPGAGAIRASPCALSADSKSRSARDSAGSTGLAASRRLSKSASSCKLMIEGSTSRSSPTSGSSPILSRAACRTCRPAASASMCQIGQHPLARGRKCSRKRQVLE